jgi:hypothetical protein
MLFGLDKKLGWEKGNGARKKGKGPNHKMQFICTFTHYSVPNTDTFLGRKTPMHASFP